MPVERFLPRNQHSRTTDLKRTPRDDWLRRERTGRCCDVSRTINPTPGTHRSDTYIHTGPRANRCSNGENLVQTFNVSSCADIFRNFAYLIVRLVNDMESTTATRNKCIDAGYMTISRRCVRTNCTTSSPKYSTRKHML